MNASASAMAVEPRRGLSHYYREYQQELCRYAVSKFGLTFVEAEDVVQCTFARSAAMLDSAELENARAFLYKAVYNASVDVMRRNRVRESYSQSVQAVPGQELDHAGPERVAAGHQFLGMINRALWAMPGKRRRLLIMNRVDGLSYAEIARRENLSETVVRKHVAKALAGCQQALRENNGEL